MNNDRELTSGSEEPSELKELTSKRKFCEPEISQPVDVLEATTFFQAVDSGPTN
jgi:hypothetical protein